MHENIKWNKSYRLLDIYEKLNRGEVIYKGKLSKIYGVTTKSLQRDIGDLRTYIAENKSFENINIEYDKKKKGYYLKKSEEWLTSREILGVCKVLLESRAFCKEELDKILKKLLLQLDDDNLQIVKRMILNEQNYYIELRHGKALLDQIWLISENIINQEVLEITYMRQDKKEVNRIVEPISIMFSEFYFYLIVYQHKDKIDNKKRIPIVYRIDRIKEIAKNGKKFRVKHGEFSDSEFKKRVQFMYSGELKKVRFEFTGPSLEAILDKLPTTKIISNKEEKYILEAESYGDGIFMWLKTQGDFVKILQ